MTRQVWRTTRQVWRTTRQVWRMTRQVWRTTRQVWRMTRQVWRMTRQVWRTTRQVWRTTRQVWRTTRQVWRTTRQVWRTTRQVWRMTRQVWRTTRQVWRMTRQVWRMTRQVWRMTRQGQADDSPRSALANSAGGRIFYGIYEVKRSDGSSRAERLTPLTDYKLKARLKTWWPTPCILNEPNSYLEAVGLLQNILAALGAARLILDRCYYWGPVHVIQILKVPVEGPGSRTGYHFRNVCVTGWSPSAVELIFSAPC
jgi:hypothetical protein